MILVWDQEIVLKIAVKNAIIYHPVFSLMIRAYFTTQSSMIDGGYDNGHADGLIGRLDRAV